MLKKRLRMLGSNGSFLGVLLLELLPMGALLLITKGSEPAGKPDDSMDDLKSLKGQDFETQFMSMMIAHHDSAVEMAQLAPDRANHTEVKDAAQKIIDAQSSENKKIEGWLQQWYNTTPMPPPPSMQQKSRSSMQKLQSADGNKFDKEFLTTFHMHHTDAIEMANLVPSRATHAELKTLAQNVITSQTAEKQQFASWLKEWFNEDVNSSKM